MTLQACIEMVDTADPDRALVLRLASDAARARLYPVYALNLEIARAAWASAEPLVAEMRLQWWRDALADLTRDRFARSHPVLAACDFLAGDSRAGALLDDLIEARRWDIWREPFDGAAGLWAHLEATGGGLMVLAGRALGVQDEGPLRDFGAASALAGWFRAVPALIERGRLPLPDGVPLESLAQEGLARLADVRRFRPAGLRPALPALLTGWQAGTVLRRVQADPALVMADGLALPELRRRSALFVRAMTGRW